MLSNGHYTKASKYFWRNHQGIERYAAVLICIAVRKGRLGEADLLLKYLERVHNMKGILPCERADLFALAISFSQGINTEHAEAMLKRMLPARTHHT